MAFHTNRLAAITFAVMTTFSAPVLAQDPGHDTVLATVNGTDITLGHVIALRATLGPQYAQYPADVLFKGILDQMIQQTLLMQSLKEEPSINTTLSIENETRALTADQVIKKVNMGKIDEDALVAAYEAKFKDPQQEYKASHILVETQEEAEALLVALEEGEDFATLAKEKSTGPSGPSGGDLGWFTEGRMVQPFFDAVEELEKGEVSKPVETQFGWHVILLTDLRAMDTPPMEDVRAEIEEELRQKAFNDFVKDLEASAVITRTDTTEMDPGLINRLELLEN